jgi:hypothetical protein
MHDSDFRATHRLRIGALLAGAALLLAAAGCGTGGKPTAPKQSLVPLTLTAQATGTGSFRAPALTAALTAGAAQSDTIDVTFSKAYLVVRDVRFILPDVEDGTSPYDSTGTQDSTGSEGMMGMTLGLSGNDSIPDMGNDEGEAVVFRGPFVIDLLDHTAAALDTMMVQPGDYHHVQGHLQALHASDAAATPDLSFLVGSTVYLEGTIGGEGGGPFTFMARIDDEFQIRSHFTVEAATPATAFITFNPDQWLLDRNGHFLDPRNPDNLQAIKSAIRHAIKVGMDDNHDGEMDDDMHDVMD